MNAFLIYILEANLYILLFGASYYFFFRNEPYHRINRWVILGSVFTSFLIPLLSFTGTSETINHVVNLNPVLITAKTTVSHTPVGYNFPSFLSIIYWLGFIVSSVFIVRRIMSLLQMLNQMKATNSEGIRIVNSPTVKSPASFFKTIFLNSELDKASEKSILAHELVHIHEKHSLDVLFMQIAQALCWFNPMIYKLMDALEATHEFRADQVATEKEIDKTEYSKLILCRAMDIHPRTLAHHFSKSNLLKRRIMMLNKSSKTRSSFWKYFLILPVLCGAIIFNACSEKNEDLNPIPQEKSAADNSQNKMDSEKIEGTDIYRIADKMPEYPGGDAAMMTFLGENIKYPADCKDEGIEGTVYISFVVDKSGEITDMKSLRSPDERLSANAMEVISKMPTWTPGENDGELVKVEYNLPIKYQLK